MMTNEILLLILLLFFSGFFSSAETALFSISRTKAIHLAKKGNKSYLLIKKMKDDPHRLLSTILIGNNIANIGASALATAVSISIIPNNAVGFATGVMTFLILVFGEVFPKSIATQNNILIAKITIYPIYWLSILLFPLVKFLIFIPRLTGKIKKSSTVTEEELMTFVEVVEEEGEIKEEEKELIYNIFEFDDTNASQIMTPRADMFVIDASEKLKLDVLGKSGFTRVPVIQGDIDHVIGIINIKDIFMHQATSGQEIDVKKIMRVPYFVPENKKLDRLLRQFKKRKNHLAIVVDEHGGVSGLISLEDVIEEIVGEISDETDRDDPHIVKLKSNEWLVLGKAAIDEVNEMLGMNIPEITGYDTFSGYILDKIGRIPEENETILVNDFNITVKKRQENRIREYIVSR